MAWGTEEAKVIREMIFREAEFTNHRVTWLVTLQGLLFAALGFAWKDGKELIPVLACLGVGVALSSLHPLYSAQRACSELVRQWDAKKDGDFDGPDVIGFRPVKWIIALSLPWFFLPFLLAVAWLVIVAVHAARV